MIDVNALMFNPFEEMEVGRKRAYAGYEAGQAAAQREALNELYAQATDPRTGQVNVNALYGGLAQRRMGAMIPGLEAEQAKLSELRGKATQEETKAIEDRMRLWRRMIPTDSRLAPAWVMGTYNDPAVGPMLRQFGSPEEVIANIPNDPAGYAKWAESSALFADQLIDAELKRRELGVRERTVTVQEKQATTAEAQERRLANAPAKVEPDDRTIVARAETSAAGDVRFYNKYGDLLKTEKGAGKPSGEFEKTRSGREETKRNLTEALTNLKEIVKKGGLIDKSTGSGFGRAVDVTAGFFGSATEGAIAAGQLAPLADQVLKLVPRFEGPQSDKDTQSYREAAGQLADPTLPNEVRKAAANTIIGLFERRKNQFTTQGAPADSGGDWQDL